MNKQIKRLVSLEISRHFPGNTSKGCGESQRCTMRAKCSQADLHLEQETLQQPLCSHPEGLSLLESLSSHTDPHRPYVRLWCSP
jgi:hypothetical protein